MSFFYKISRIGFFNFVDLNCKLSIILPEQNTSKTKRITATVMIVPRTYGNNQYGGRTRPEPRKNRTIERNRSFYLYDIATNSLVNITFRVAGPSLPPNSVAHLTACTRDNAALPLLHIFHKYYAVRASGQGGGVNGSVRVCGFGPGRVRGGVFFVSGFYRRKGSRSAHTKRINTIL